MNRTLKPECKCYVDNDLSMIDVRQAYEQNLTLTANVVFVDATHRQIILKLSDCIIATMSWEDATICDLTNKNTKGAIFPDQIYSIFNKNIRVKVKEIKDNGDIIVSRKANMIKAWKEIVNAPNDYIFDAAVIGVHKYGSAVFYDVGEGITGFCHVNEFSSTIVELKDWVEYGEIHQVKKYGLPDLKNYSINCSRKMACTKGYKDFSRYQIVPVRIAALSYDAKKYKDYTGYHVEVNPIVCGIADFPYIPREIKYGETVDACISKIKPTERRMSLAIL